MSKSRPRKKGVSLWTGGMSKVPRGHLSSNSSKKFTPNKISRSVYLQNNDSKNLEKISTSVLKNRKVVKQPITFEIVKVINILGKYPRRKDIFAVYQNGSLMRYSINSVVPASGLVFVKLQKQLNKKK
jgi:hypothetical protein